jgi:hypothetical protein
MQLATVRAPVGGPGAPCGNEWITANAPGILRWSRVAGTLAPGDGHGCPIAASATPSRQGRITRACVVAKRSVTQSESMLDVVICAAFGTTRGAVLVAQAAVCAQSALLDSNYERVTARLPSWRQRTHLPPEQ